MLRGLLDVDRFTPWAGPRLPGELEERFRAEAGQSSAAFVRFWMGVFILFNVLSLKLDYDAFGPEGFSVPVVLTLGVFLPVALAGIVMLGGTPSPRRVTGVATVVSLVDMAIVLHSAETAPRGYAEGYLVLAVIVPLVIGLISPLSFRHSFVFCGAAFVLYLGRVLLLPSGNFVGDATANGLPLLVACLILVPIKIAFSRERQERQAFLLRLTLELQASELAAANTRLRILSETDALTGLANRRAFDASLAAAWDAAETWCAVVAIDIDHFKRLNDTAGHPEGDRCLVAVADILGAVTREAGGLLGRYGGEEFMAMVPVREPDEAVILSERLRAAVEALAYRYGPEDDPTMVTVSVGVTIAHGATGTCGLGPLDLVKAADAALYRAKRLGRNRVETGVTVPRSANRDGGPVAVYSAASS
ncbi:GGDEF domain-containing protein [Methylobacterium gossipiicola]|uniref:diguanylate cyclase n=1 Tax=Methylobacterium gossipiicola TaxID=582675 RepID=A0A1I2W991_9HYPH|nr:diguanylate cyclase [Methylobacterium gossipiicola]SFG97935.1 diguanylate cyclase (GGDEF) domain-containing protein [Methylobacterium gossipiicola]